MRSASFGSRQKMRNAWSKIGRCSWRESSTADMVQYQSSRRSGNSLRARELERAHAVDHAVGPDAHARGAQQAREVHDVLGQAPRRRRLADQAACSFGGRHSRAIFSTAGEAFTACSRK